MKLFYQYMTISFNFLPTSNHLHPLQVENCDSNSRLVVDEDDNAKSGLKGLRHISTYISQARAIFIFFFYQTPHVLLAGTGAREFAVKSGCKMVTKQYLVTDKASLQLTDFPEFSPASKAEFYETTYDKNYYYYNIKCQHKWLD